MRCSDYVVVRMLGLEALEDIESTLGRGSLWRPEIAALRNRGWASKVDLAPLMSEIKDIRSKAAPFISIQYTICNT